MQAPSPAHLLHNLAGREVAAQPHAAGVAELQAASQCGSGNQAGRWVAARALHFCKLLGRLASRS